MATTVVTPGDIIPPRSRVAAGTAAIIERPSLIRRFGNFIRRRWDWLRSVGRSARGKTASAARRSGRTVNSGFRAAITGVERVGAWFVGVGASLWMFVRTVGNRTVNGVRYLGRSALRGFSYGQYLGSVAYGWVAQTVQGTFFLSVLGVVGVLALAVKISDWWVEAYEYDAKFWRWWSMGKEQREGIRRGELKVPVLYRRAYKRKPEDWGDGDPSRRERFVNWLASIFMGGKVEVVKAYDEADDEAILPDDTFANSRTKTAGPGMNLGMPWNDRTNERMDDYEGMNLGDVLERHQKRLQYVDDSLKDLNQIAYWTGRIYFLENYLADEENLGRLDPLYNAWRDQQPKKRGPGPAGLPRGKFRDGMVDERRILREDLEAKQEALAGAE